MRPVHTRTYYLRVRYATNHKMSNHNGGNKNNINTRIKVLSISYPNCNPCGNTTRLINVWSVRREKEIYVPTGNIYIYTVQTN